MKLTYLASIIFVTNLVLFKPVHPEPVEGCTEKPAFVSLEDFGSDDDVSDDSFGMNLDELDVMAKAIENVDLDIEPPAWYLMWLQKFVVKTKILALYLTLHAWYAQANSWVNTTVFCQPHENK